LRGWDRSRLRAKSEAWIEKAKKRAASEAVKHVRDGFIVGLGSGSTAAYAIQEIGKIVQNKGWRVLGVPTSHQAFLLAIECGIPVTTLNENPQLDVSIDGVDQIDRRLDMIKGGGGALTREKIVASASKRNIIVADETKLVEKLGADCPVPIEVLPFAASTVMSKIEKMKGKPVLREGKGRIGPVVTDNGNFIIDAHFGPIESPNELNSQLRMIPGVVETGLFIGMADTAYIGTPTTVQKLQRK